jgi:hypothetical protein
MRGVVVKNIEPKGHQIMAGGEKGVRRPETGDRRPKRSEGEKVRRVTRESRFSGSIFIISDRETI